MQQARQLSNANRLTSLPQPGRTPGINPRPGIRGKKTKLIFILLTCFLLSLAVVAQYSSIVILNYRLSSSRAQLGDMREVTRELELNAAQLGSINRIEHVAREELGMVEPELGQLRVITADRSSVTNRLGE